MFSRWIKLATEELIRLSVWGDSKTEKITTDLGQCEVADLTQVDSAMVAV